MVKQFAGHISVTHVICLAGLLPFGIWLLKTSFGRNALVDSVLRRNNMRPFMPFVLLFIWFGAVAIAISFIEKVLPDLPDWQNAFLDNLILCIGAIAAMVVIISLVKNHFARRLKGFGLNPRTIHRDLPAAIVNLLSVVPLLTAMLILTTFFGRFIWGQDFHIPQHEELEMITAHPQLPLRVLIIVTTIAIVPVFEEMLFRGLFQTVIRSFVISPWLSILISSGLFTLIHGDAGHWPALFVLAVCMGYAYEKSGSLFRPIFIHALFNASSIIAALYQ